MSSLAVRDDVTPVEPGIDLQTAALVINELRAGGVLETTGTSLTLDRGLPYEKYEQLGAALGLINRSCAWWIGDWLLFGEGNYGERFAQAAEATGLAEQTLLNRITVCRAIAPGRRQPGLSFSTHALVAPLGAREQRRWLRRAVEEGWTRAELDKALKEAKADSGQEQLPGLPPEVVSTDQVIEAARSLVHNAEQAGENVICRIEDFTRLRAALGEEA